MEASACPTSLRKEPTIDDSNDPAMVEQAEMAALARRLLRALAEDAGAQRPGVPVYLNVGKAIDGLTYAMALLVEATPELSRTPREIRKLAEGQSKSLRDYVSAFQVITQHSGGIPVLEAHFGGMRSFEEDPSVVRALNESAHNR